MFYSGCVTGFYNCYSYIYSASHCNLKAYDLQHEFFLQLNVAGICKIRLANFIENHHIPFVKILSLFLQNFVHSLHSKIRKDGEPCFLSITAYTSQCFHGRGGYRYEEILQRTNKQAISQFSAIWQAMIQ